MERVEFDEKVKAMYRDMVKEVIPILEKHDSPHVSIVGAVLSAIIKVIADSVPFKDDFLRVIINDLHDYRLKEQNPMVAECDRCKERKVIDAMTDTHILCATCWLEYKQELAEMVPNDKVDEGKTFD